MKVGIYSEPMAGSVGGGELTAAVLAEALAQNHEVEIVHHQPAVTSVLLSETFGLNLARVRSRPLPYDNANHPKRRRWRRWYGLDAWHAELSRPYDLFVNFTHGLPPFCHAKSGVLVILFPIFQPFDAWPWAADAPRHWPLLPAALQRRHFEHSWLRRMQSYSKIVAISEFARRWSQTRWRVDCEVIHPPVHTHATPGDKENLILSVGRFVRLKNQLELAVTFRRLVDDGLREWRLACAGGLSEFPEDRNYFAEVGGSGPAGSMKVLANVERHELEKLFARAKIFWHSAGYGSDGAHYPERMEHFGIVTVEAMAAGCVPVVIDGGGQSEIVEHGVSGFLWRSLEELAEYTLRLVHDESLRERMSVAARRRSRQFDRQRFVDRFGALLRPFLS
jgi:L-malate glycosyltransferase